MFYDVSLTMMFDLYYPIVLNFSFDFVLQVVQLLFLHPSETSCKQDLEILG